MSQPKEPTAKKNLGAEGESPNAALGAEEAVPEESSLPLWSCEVSAYQKALEDLNVGDLFLLKCKGDEIVDRLEEVPQIKFLKKDDDYKLKIVKSHISNPLQKDFIVTSYKPGEHKGVSLQVIGTSSSGFKVDNLEWTVKSVIDPQKPPPKEFGPFGPLEIPMPWWYWAFWISALLTVLLVLGRVLRKYLQRRKLLEELEIHGTALPPIQVYNKEIRVLVREASLPDKIRTSPFSDQDYFKAIEKSFKMYIVRTFKVPAHIWSAGAVLSDLKKRHKKVYHDEGGAIKKLFVEIDKAHSSLDKVTKEDCEQFIEMSRVVMQRVERKRKGSNR